MVRKANARQTSSGTVRAVSLLGFRELVEDLGGDADALLRSAGIDPRVLDDPENRLSYASVIGVFEDAARKLGCPDFGCRLADNQDIGILGPAAMIALNSDTVGECFEAIASYFYVHVSGGVVRLVHREDGSSDWTFEVLLPGLHAKPQINELSGVLAQQLLEMLVAPGFRSERVQFSNRRPTDIRHLRRRFGPHLHFDCAVSSIAVPAEVLARPVSSANASFRRIASQYVRDHLPHPQDDPARRVGMLVRQLLPTGRCTLEAVADVLEIHPRALQRRLRETGEDFRGIVDRVRRDLVTGYLGDTSASLGQVASMLGYGDQAAFTNAFRRWFGESPGRWRGKR